MLTLTLPLPSTTVTRAFAVFLLPVARTGLLLEGAEAGAGVGADDADILVYSLPVPADLLGEVADGDVPMVEL